MTMSLFYKALAEGDADEQAEFFNGFYHALKMCCHGKHETQICYIAERLDSNGREFAKMLNSFADLAVESRATLEANIKELWEQKRSLEKEIAEVKEAAKIY